MSVETLAVVLASVVVAATPILLAALGELVVEKSGVLNLGLEGMMLMGAVCGFATAYSTGNNFLALIIAALGSMLISLIFAFLTQVLMTNQVATGLALSIFGVGLSSLIGKDFVGVRIDQLSKVDLPFFSDIPFLGKFLFQHDLIVYFSIIMTYLIYRFVYKSRSGLVLRAIGENHDAAHALGYHVVRIRVLAILFGAAMAGIAGAYLSLAYTPHWSEGMTAGKGWIALALVVFSAWKPSKLLMGSYFFGAILMSQLYLQGLGVPISPQFLSMTPYMATIFILILISKDRIKLRLSVPGALGKTFWKS